MKLAHQVSVVRGLIVVHLDDEPAHAGFLGELRQLERVERSAVVPRSVAVGIHVRVDVDGAAQRRVVDGLRVHRRREQAREA